MKTARSKRKLHKKPRLLATTVAEYDKLRREYPDMEIRLDTSGQEQIKLFDTRGLHDAG